MIKEKKGRRKSEPRFDFKKKVLISVSGLDEAHEEWSENLSAGGIFLHTQSPYPIGTTIELEIEYFEDQQKKTIHVLGEVVWTKEFRDAVNRERSGMGVRFTEFRGQGQAEFESLLALLAED